MNGDDPTDRYHLIARVGPDEYARLLAQHHQASTLETVNGHAIRPVSTRFGRLFMVGATGKAFSTLDDARAYAEEHPL